MAFLYKINQKWKMFISIQLWIVVKFGTIMLFKITHPPMETISTCLWILFRPGKMPGKKNAEFSHTSVEVHCTCGWTKKPDRVMFSSTMC